MKNLSKSKLIKDLLKILKVKDKKKLSIIKRIDFDKWDSLTHLQVIFFWKKILSKKYQLKS